MMLIGDKQCVKQEKDKRAFSLHNINAPRKLYASCNTQLKELKGLIQF